MRALSLDAVDELVLDGGRGGDAVHPYRGHLS
jgi:hypothetical protein